ncbi:DUF1419 domain-containing protein [Mesorhizobium sp.]|uniref:DUF1419 domain-containing protein n=1 Tax=Mesorhizobium sp. TaxID=1871066 RepID=UPI000FE75D4E|nr:DUF1419 domain-containing protein [Mesorhizobium sp.]RWF83130.1 MAG: DUF1419 domain-containing protein [Mesorhizobium sp.]RWG06710.1 MAG: DUF1419 domain-containing protein [Mesorhizobium sp.]RWG78397.1 MAG: DUF1419 domain-containing protein [Mesorhizobium sp.]RWH07415.1 MAG: DUF1419 domain-containing protein [Mesorhizobium sp.]RWH07696.1 MAG: DUF1419 domain-containing protein [Mesorhizobium sp.]
MNLSIPIRKIYQGVADRRQMFRLFDRHAQRPNRFEDDASALYRDEWFELARSGYDYMLEILPPLWMRGDMFAMREFLTDSVTSIFFALTIDGRIRFFHGYCDLFDRGSPERMRDAIVERESWPVKAMTHEERLEHIWSATHDDYRGYAGERFLPEHRGKRTVLVYGRGRTELKLLDELNDEEIAAKLPVHLRHLPLKTAA